MIRITPRIALEEGELQWKFVHASGPGGQNVNKVATAVQLRFDAARSPALPEDVRQRLIRLAGRRMTREGILIIDARRFRTQGQNRQEALERLTDLIRKAAERPRARRPTRMPAASRKRRLEAKQRRGKLKRLREPVPPAPE